jgi:hypothetical protein
VIFAVLPGTRSAWAHMDNLEPPRTFGRGPESIYALREPYIFTHNVGLLTLQITNVGIIGNPFIDALSAGWRGGEYLFFSGLWIGAIGSDSETHVSTASPLELRPELSTAWTVYQSFEGIEGGVRLGLLGASAANDDGDLLVDEDFQNGLDDDGDGRFDEDFEAIGQQMFSTMYKDDTPEAVAQISDHFPLNLLIRQRSFQWSTTGLNEFVGFDFQIVNAGDQRLKEVYLGFFSDTDAGPKSAEQYWSDDLVGWAHIDTTIVDPTKAPGCQTLHLGMDTAFMWDAKDDGVLTKGGDVPGVFGSLFLGHTTDDTGIRAPQNVGLTTVAWFSSSGQNSDPQNDDERYQLLSKGKKPDKNANKPDDYRYVIAAGPFVQLNPGESLVFQSAYVIGDGQTGFRANAVNAQRVYNGQYLNVDENEKTGVDGKERCLQVLEPGSQVIWDDPCDTLETTVSYKYPTPACDTEAGNYVDADCDQCTGVTGAETLVNWVGTTAPTSPTTNVDPKLRATPPGFSAFQDPAGDRKVILQWDNASELNVDPITRVKFFTGYRVWRVDNWQRPEGSIGPSQEEWMKIAEFRNDNLDSANSRGAIPLNLIFPEGPTVRMSHVEGDTAKDGTWKYPIGRYRYEDLSGIINGKIYFYAVTAFGIMKITNSVTGQEDRIELSGLPSAAEAAQVVPRWEATEGCGKVTVVPNPYRGRADWDLVPSERDPTGTRIAFRDLPQERSTIRIYTLSGDLVKEAENDGSGGEGTYFWDMITRNGQNVVSGIYLYSVETEGGETCRGRFVIIR